MVKSEWLVTISAAATFIAAVIAAFKKPEEGADKGERKPTTAKGA